MGEQGNRDATVKNCSRYRIAHGYIDCDLELRPTTARNFQCPTVVRK